MLHLIMISLASLVLLAGCSGKGDNLHLAEAGGIVLYQGAPVEGATVTFIPEQGPPSIAKTDAQGRFALTTQGQPGAVVGANKVSILAVKQSREITDGELREMSSQELASIRKSLIPEKYNNGQTSGLAATVTEDPAQNDFKFEL